MIEDYDILSGHTHRYEKDEVWEREGRYGPSPEDLEGSQGKPELVFTALQDRWLIHATICGEVIETRQYAREL